MNWIYRFYKNKDILKMIWIKAICYIMYLVIYTYYYKLICFYNIFCLILKLQILNYYKIELYYIFWTIIYYYLSFIASL